MGSESLMTRENLSNVPSTAASDLLQGLSPRQRAIAERYASGLTYRQIAAELFIAPATVRNHLATIYRELEIDNKADLIRRMTAAEQAAETLEAITAAAALDAAPEPAATTADDRIDDRIYEWLQALSLERYAEIFAANAIDWHTLPTLNDEDLQAIGIDLIGHRKKLLQALDGLKIGRAHV